MDFADAPAAALHLAAALEHEDIATASALPGEEPEAVQDHQLHQAFAPDADGA